MKAMAASVLVAGSVVSASLTSALTSQPELAVFSSHAEHLHYPQSLDDPSQMPAVPPLSLSSAGDVIGALAGKSLSSRGNYYDDGAIPVSLDLFTRPELSLFVAVEGTQPSFMSNAGSKHHNLRTFPVAPGEKMVERIVSRRGFRSCAGSSAKSLCMGEQKFTISSVSEEDTVEFLKELGFSASFDKDLGDLVVGGISISDGNFIAEIKEIVGMVKDVEKKKRGGGGGGGDGGGVCGERALDLLVVNVSGLVGMEDSELGVATAVVEKVLEKLVDAVSTSACGGTFSLLRGQRFSGAADGESDAARSLLEASEERQLNAGRSGNASSIPARNGTLTSQDIEMYQVSLWITVALVLTAFTMLCSTAFMDTNMDPMLLIKFKADTGYVMKYD